MHKKFIMVILITLMLIGMGLINTFTRSANIARDTPTLAPTMCPGWNPDIGCPATATPIVICIPGPCLWFPSVHNMYLPIIRGE